MSRRRCSGRRVQQTEFAVAALLPDFRVSTPAGHDVLPRLRRRLPSFNPDQQLVVFGGEDFFVDLPRQGGGRLAARCLCGPVRPSSRYRSSAVRPLPYGSVADSWWSRPSCRDETACKGRGSPRGSDCAEPWWQLTSGRLNWVNRARSTLARRFSASLLQVEPGHIVGAVEALDDFQQVTRFSNKAYWPR